MTSVFTVDDDRIQLPQAQFTSIQAAIDAASPGDTVKVYPGLYDEQITINKPLVLLGAQADANPAQDGREESIIKNRYPLTITSGDVVINGFEVKDFRIGINIPVSSFASAGGKTLKNITICSCYVHSKDAFLGINTEPGVLRNLKIQRNIIAVDQSISGGDPYALAAINLGGGSSVPRYEGVEINFNILENLNGKYCLLASADPATYLIDGLKMVGNYFASASGSSCFHACNIYDGEMYGNVVDGAGCTLGIQSGVISGNLFKNGGSLSLWGDEYGFRRPSKDVAVINNEFTNEIFGRGLTVRKGVDSESILVAQNAFGDAGITPIPHTSIGYMVRNLGQGVLKADQNWWGPGGSVMSTGGIAGPVETLPFIASYKQESAKDVVPKEWPLSEILDAYPGFWATYVRGIRYIGKTNTTSSEYPVLSALINFPGGRDIPVEFTVDGNTTLSTTTLLGGYASVCAGRLSPGQHTITVRAGGLAASRVISVKPSS